PARNPRQVLVGSRVSVVTGAGPSTSRRTSTTRARTSSTAHIGLTSSRYRSTGWGEARAATARDRRRRVVSAPPTPVVRPGRGAREAMLRERLTLSPPFSEHLCTENPDAGG